MNKTVSTPRTQCIASHISQPTSRSVAQLFVNHTIECLALVVSSDPGEAETTSRRMCPGRDVKAGRDKGSSSARNRHLALRTGF
jgi:hypothetical protein